MAETNSELTAVQQLAKAIVDCHEPKLLEAEDELKDLTVKQDLLFGELQKQNRRLEDAVGQAKVHEMAHQTKIYYDKVTLLKKEMDSLTERVQRIKKRALRLQQQKHHEALLREQAKDRELEREKQLIARPAKRN